MSHKRPKILTPSNDRILSPKSARCPIFRTDDKLTRNAKCQCGSGLKQKNCCGDKPKYASLKPYKTVQIPKS